ncbi:MAG: twin-arginine translocase TatA/TatE family subunit [Bacteroidota bacterium]
MFSGGIGATEILIVFLIILVLFGAKRIPELARGLGQGMKEFRQASKDIKKELDDANQDINSDMESDEKTQARK